MDYTLDLDPLSDNDVAEFDDDDDYDALDHPIMDDEEERAEDDYIDEAENCKTSAKKQNFTVLNESDIKQLQEANITDVSSVLSISRVAACLLLRHYDWSVNKVHEAWFDDEEGVRKAVGLQKEPQVGFPNSQTLTCEICFEALSCVSIKSAGCGHPYCINCWKQYVDAKIEEGPDRCLKLRCPEPSCDAAVDADMIHEFASESNNRKYDQFLFRSYVENNKKMKWCPGPACEFAVSFEADDASANSDVTCLCYHSFCWICGEDAHSPVGCETVGEWIRKNNSESENTTWILAYTKPCPECKKPIEKNQGCMHMTCKCGFHFCWLCLHDWSKCGYSGCNRFTQKQVKKLEEEDEVETKRKKARDYLERYTHYYERWASNEFSRKKALGNLSDMNAQHIKRLSASYQKPETDFQFINVAWLQIVECRRVLKWTYAYGYYLPENEKAKKEFFEYTQGEAEAALERLHYCAERELRDFLCAEPEPHAKFNDFRLKLINLTSVNKSYFENLVRALENGLADVHVKNYTGVKRGSCERGESSERKGNRRTINIDGLTDNDLWQCEECGHYNVASARVCQDITCRRYSDQL